MGSERTKTEICQGFEGIDGLICRGTVDMICAAITYVMLTVTLLIYLGLQAKFAEIYKGKPT